MHGRGNDASAEHSASAARGAAPSARRELPALLRHLADTTTQALAREALDGERERIRAYVDRQMNSQFAQQLHMLKVQLSEFIRDFVEVKSAEAVGLSASRDSVRAEHELRDVQASVEALQQRVERLGAPPSDALLAQLSARVAEQDRAVERLSAENAALGELLAAQRVQTDELRQALAAAGDAELNGFFGEGASFSVITRNRDDTPVDEWLLADAAPGKDGAKRLSTTLCANAPVVSLGSPTAAREETPRHVFPMRAARARLESAFPGGDWTCESGFFIDASGAVTDARGVAVADESGNARRIDESQFEFFGQNARFCAFKN